MNIVKIIREELIKEVGSLDRTYRWEGPLESGWMDDVSYFFTADKGSKYVVKFQRFPDNEWEREFTADGKYMETSEGDVYKVMSTVTQITLDFIDQYEPMLIEIPHVDTKKEVQKTFSDLKANTAMSIIDKKNKTSNKRARLNQIYLSNNLPDGYTYQLKGSKSIITSNEKR